jgi:ferredoxin-NADP reductase
VGTPKLGLDEVAQFDRRLHRQASAHVLGSGDPTLTDLLQTIELRRARRMAPSASSPGDTAGGSPRILALAQHGPTVKVFRVSRPAGFTFEPGQYVKLGGPGGRREKFSLASAPHEPYLEFAIELRPGGRVTPALFALRVGDAVELDLGAKGSLRLDARAAHHLMIATVTGIAPLRSMVRAALHEAGAASFTVLLGASLAIELPFHDELTDLAAREPHLSYRATVSRQDQPGSRMWQGATGRVDELAKAVATTLDPATTQVYAVGHGGMIASVHRSLGSLGFRIATESYGG